jgi:hypothetical protein
MNMPTLAAAITEFRVQVAHHAAIVTDANDDDELVERTYGPTLEALCAAPPARTREEALAAMRLMMEGQFDELENSLGCAVLAWLEQDA